MLCCPAGQKLWGKAELWAKDGRQVVPGDGIRALFSTGEWGYFRRDVNSNLKESFRLWVDVIVCGFSAQL